ncbi:MAG: hypothetical protein WA542_19235 [Candidatus Acidiferrum sp.]
MAIEKRISAKLDDLEIVLVCTAKDCGTRMTYALTKLPLINIPGCPVCSPRQEGPGELQQFKKDVRTMLASAGKVPFEIRLEFIAPVESRPQRK